MHGTKSTKCIQEKHPLSSIVNRLQCTPPDYNLDHLPTNGSLPRPTAATPTAGGRYRGAALAASSHTTTYWRVRQIALRLRHGVSDGPLAGRRQLALLCLLGRGPDAPLRPRGVSGPQGAGGYTIPPAAAASQGRMVLE